MKLITGPIAKPIFYGLLLLFLLSAFLLLFAFKQTKTVTMSVPVVSYEQQGNFDYQAHMKPSYFYGDLPLHEDSTEPIKYDPGIIDSCAFKFAYSFQTEGNIETIKETARITALIQQPNAKIQEIMLAEGTSSTPQCLVSFALEPKDLIQRNDIILRAEVDVTAKVDGRHLFNYYMHDFRITAIGDMVQMDAASDYGDSHAVNGVSFSETSNYSYLIKLKDDSLFGAITLVSPTATPPPPRILDSESATFKKLIEDIDLSYDYNVVSSIPLDSERTELEIWATVGSTNLWEKKFLLYPRATITPGKPVNIPIDLDYYNEVVARVKSEIGPQMQPASLSIESNVYLSGETPFGSINKTFSQNLTTSLDAPTLDWNKQLSKQERDTMSQVQTVLNTAKYLGMGIMPFRVFSISIAAILLVCVSLLGYYLYRKGAFSTTVTENEGLRKKRKGQIAEVAEIPISTNGDKTILFSSLTELVTAADNMLKPILHHANNEREIYLVIDGTTRYEYSVDLSWLKS